MAKDGAVYVCQSCGAVSAKWAGQCVACSAWNSLVEEVSSRPPGALAPAKGAKTRGLSFEGLESQGVPAQRLITGLEEFDRVCGGGVVPGSAILIAGDPGVGKATLLLRGCAQGALRGARGAPRAATPSLAKMRSSRSARGRSAWAWAARQCASPPRPRGATSSMASSA